jgi:hypothetical protein
MQLVLSINLTDRTKVLNSAMDMRRLDDRIILVTTTTTTAATTTTTTTTTTFAAAATTMKLAGYSFAWYCVGSEFESRP